MRGNNNDGGREAFDDDQNILCQNPGWQSDLVSHRSSKHQSEVGRDKLRIPRYHSATGCSICGTIIEGIF